MPFLSIQISWSAKRQFFRSLILRLFFLLCPLSMYCESKEEKDKAIRVVLIDTADYGLMLIAPFDSRFPSGLNKQ